MEKRRDIAEFENKIFLGDCKEQLAFLPDESVDLIVTSPPYNIGKEYEKKAELDDYLKEQEEVIKECVRILKKTGSIFWQIGAYTDNGSIIPLDYKIFPIFEKFNLIPKNRIVWIRPHGLHAQNKFSCRHEAILWFAKSKESKFFLDNVRVPQKYPQKTAYRGKNQGKLSSNPLGKNPGDVWAFRNVKHNHEEETIHPAQFPEDMIERIVFSTTEEGDIVYDPYMGSGTTAVVAKRTNRKFIGAELMEEYWKVAMNRLSGKPDENNNFANLRALRDYAENNKIKDLSKFKFDVQVGKKPSLDSKIFPEEIHLERFIERTAFEAEKARYKTKK